MADSVSEYSSEDMNDFQDVEDDMRTSDEEEEKDQVPDFLNVGQEE